MLRAAVRAGAVLAPPAVIVAGLTRGVPAAATAAAGVALVVGWFALTGASLAWGARRSPTAYLAVGFGGYVLRVAGLGLAAVLLAPVASVDAPVLAVTVVVGMVSVLAYEVRELVRRPELWWVTPRNDRSRWATPTSAAGDVGTRKWPDSLPAERKEGV